MRNELRTLHAIERTGSEMVERSISPTASLRDMMRFVSSINSRASLRFSSALLRVLPSEMTPGISSIHAVYPPRTFFKDRSKGTRLLSDFRAHSANGMRLYPLRQPALVAVVWSPPRRSGIWSVRSSVPAISGTSEVSCHTFGTCCRNTQANMSVRSGPAAPIAMILVIAIRWSASRKRIFAIRRRGCHSP